MKMLIDPIVATEAQFLKEGVDYEALGLADEYELCQFRFNIDEVCNYNPHKGDKTTLRFKNGDSFCINLSFEIFDELFISLLKSRK